jgi:phosphoribosylformylglycinamidine synthase PurS subunit
MPRVKVFITLKPALLDSQGRTLQEALHALGYDSVEQVHVGKYLELDVADGPESEAAVKEMCDKLLANPVTENYRIEVAG